MRHALNITTARLASFEDIVRREVRRIGYVPGYDLDDLSQEARVAVSLALAKHDASRNTGRALVAVAVRNKLVNVKRNATTAGRVPLDHWGRRTHVRSADAPLSNDDATSLVDSTAAPTPVPEESASARELVRALDEKLSKSEMALLVAAFVEGAKVSTARARGERVSAAEVERVRSTARDALVRMLGQRRMLTETEHRVDRRSEDQMAKKTTKNVKLPVVKAEDLPECHASLPTGPGYDPNEVGCRDQCPDKFTCVRDLVNDRSKNTDGRTLDVDTEVRAVLEGALSYEDAIERMKQRNALVESGGAIPDSLSTTKPFVADDETPEGDESAPEETESEESEPEVEETESEPEESASDESASAESDETNDETPTEDATMSSKKKGAKKAAKKTATKKAPAKAAPAPKPAKAAKKAAAKKSGEKKSRKGVPRIPAEKRVAIYSEGHHRFLPQPRTLDGEQMSAALARVKLGQTFDLAIGMEIVRKKRDGSEVAVKIAKDGFVMDGVTYPSLSAAGQWASKRAVSGNDFFNTQSYSCTEIRGKGVPGGVFSKQGEGKPAVVGAHGAKSDDAPKKKAPAKAAKKAPAKKAPAKKAPAPKKGAKKASAKKAPPPPPPKKAAKKAAKKTSKK